MKKIFFAIFLITSLICSTNNLFKFAFNENNFIEQNHNTVTPYNEFDNNYFNETNVQIETPFNYSMAHFFENSLHYAPSNHDSCGYVSLIQTLSFYDTFLNDSIIPEQYERKKTDTSSFSQFSYNSPGVYRETQSIPKQNYESYCRETASFNFQSYLTLIYNDQVFPNSQNFESSTHMNEYDDIFRYVNIPILRNARMTIFTAFDAFNPTISEQLHFQSFIIQNILNGNPVIVHVRNSTDNSLHSVVAYKIQNGDIYANYGWNYSHCNRKLLNQVSNDFDSIYAVCAFDFSNLTHQHCDNYIVSNMNYCGCGFSPNYFIATSTDWNNIPATFTWMKNPLNDEEEYYLHFKLGINGPTIYSYNTAYNRVTFSLNSWAIIRNYTSTFIYVFLERVNDPETDNLNYIIINDPYKDMDSTIFNSLVYSFNSNAPTGVEFNQSINNSNELQRYDISSVAAYEEGDFIIMSAKQANVMSSFLEFSAEKIYRIDLDYRLYSDNEFVSHDVTEFKLQYKTRNSQNRIDFIDLFAFSSSNNRNLKIIFPEEVITFRLFLSPNAGMNYLNGRVKISQISLYINN